MGAGADAGATKSVLGDAGTACDSERGGMADGRARVPEVLAPAEFEGFFPGIVRVCGKKEKVRSSKARTI